MQIFFIAIRGLRERRLWGKIERETVREEETMSGWLKWDGEILLWIQEHVRAGGLNGAMRAITHLGDAARSGFCSPSRC